MRFSSSLWPHQNLDIKELISLHRVFGSWKTLIVYVGIACITALSNTSLPAWDKKVSFHPCMRSQILPLIPIKAIDRDWPIIAGRPRYLSKFEVMLTPAVPARNSFSSALVFLLKKIEVLSRFNFCPDAFS
jgi:hypothetical protein